MPYNHMLIQKICGVFKCFLKMFVEELFLIEKGSSFHSFGWATEKDLFPYDLMLTAGTSSTLLDTGLT